MTTFFETPESKKEAEDFNLNPIIEIDMADGRKFFFKCWIYATGGLLYEIINKEGETLQEFRSNFEGNKQAFLLLVKEAQGDSKWLLQKLHEQAAVRFETQSRREHITLSGNGSIILINSVNSSHSSSISCFSSANNLGMHVGMHAHACSSILFFKYDRSQAENLNQINNSRNEITLRALRQILEKRFLKAIEYKTTPGSDEFKKEVIYDVR